MKLTEYVDEETGMTCAFQRVHLGSSSHLCGYVEVPKISWYYGHSCNDAPRQWQDAAHQFLTYSGELTHDGRWWVGYDTAHYEDLLNPKDEAFIRLVNRRLAAVVKASTIVDEVWEEEVKAKLAEIPTAIDILNELSIRPEE